MTSHQVNPWKKLIRRKQEWARDGRLLTGKVTDTTRERLPPGQRLVKDWPLLDLGITPECDLQKWGLRIDGAVENKIIWGWTEFLAQPQVKLFSDIHCVTGWSRYDNAWEGISAEHLLSLVKPFGDARYCIFYSSDGYCTNIRLDRFAFFVHWVELQFDLAFFRVEQNNAISIQSVASSIHGNFVSESIMELASVFGGIGLAVFASFERFPFAASF